MLTASESKALETGKLRSNTPAAHIYENSQTSGMKRSTVHSLPSSISWLILVSACIRPGGTEGSDWLKRARGTRVLAPRAAVGIQGL